MTLRDSGFVGVTLIGITFLVLHAEQLQRSKACEFPNQLAAFVARQQGGCANILPDDHAQLNRWRAELRTQKPEQESSVNIALLLARELTRGGCLGEAERLYQTYLPIARKLLGDSHPLTIKLMVGYADVERRYGVFDLSERVDMEALTLSRKSFGDASPEAVLAMNELASVYEDERRTDWAADIYQQTLTINQRTLGKENPQTAAAMNNLAIVREEQGRTKEAEQLVSEALRISRRFRQSNAYVANLASMQKGDTAIEVYRDAISFSDKRYGCGSAESLALRNMLANLYLRRSLYADAEPLFEQVYTGRLQRWGSLNDATKEAYDALNTCYAMQGRIDKISDPIARRKWLGMRVTLRDGGDH
ncbi:MAG TPA: tetratricopeptide repeat protein [Planktothrix sp.]|jgi:tetratricopeptide (TPR) repeat protein